MIDKLGHWWLELVFYWQKNYKIIIYIFLCSIFTDCVERSRDVSSSVQGQALRLAARCHLRWWDFSLRWWVHHDWSCGDVHQWQGWPYRGPVRHRAEQAERRSPGRDPRGCPRPRRVQLGSSLLLIGGQYRQSKSRFGAQSQGGFFCCLDFFGQDAKL